jgi:hypothetical protein
MLYSPYYVCIFVFQYALLYCMHAKLRNVVRLHLKDMLGWFSLSSCPFLFRAFSKCSSNRIHVYWVIPFAHDYV